MIQKEKFYFVKEKFYFVKLIIMIVTALILSGCIPRVGTSGQEGSGEYVRGKVVEGFPPLPLYEGAQVVESYSYQGTFGATFETSDDLGKVINFYNESLPKLGWDMVVDAKSQTNYVFEIKNVQNKGEIIVNIAADGKKTAITMAVGPR